MRRHKRSRPRRVLFAIAVMLPTAYSQFVAGAEDDPKTGSSQGTVVEVTGTGVDAESAKTDAYREAVRQVVGLYTTSKTRTDNDEVIEDRIISLSSGLVEKAETLKVGKQDDLVRVRMRCTVRVTKVLDRLKSNKIAVTKVDGQSLGAELLGKADQEDGKEELLREAFDGFPGAWFKADVQGKPRLGDRTASGGREVFVTIGIAADLEAYTPAAAKLVEALKADGTPMREFDVDGSRCGPRRTWDQENAARDLGEIVSGATVTQISYLNITRGISEELAESIHEGKTFAFPVSFYAGGKRSHWMACQLSDKQRELLKQASQMVKNVPHMTCKTRLLDADNEPIVVNDTVVGVPRDTDRPFGALLSKDFRIMAPASVDSLSPNGIVLIPQFSMECQFELDESEVAAIDSIETTIEPQPSF